MPPTVDIVYHNPSLTRPDRWAGERARQLIDALTGAGGEVLAIPAPIPEQPTTDSGRPIASWTRSRVPRPLRRPLIKLRLFQRGTVNTVRWSWRLWRALRSNPPPVLLARYLEFEWTPLIVARLLRRPLVLEVHSPFALEGVMRGERPSRLLGWMDGFFWRRADIIWVHTPALRDLIVDRVADPGKVRLIPFGVEDPGVRAQPGTDTGSIEVVFVGSFYPWHGIEDLLAAVTDARRHVPALHLTVVGDGLDRTDHEQLSEKLGIADSVSFPGWLQRPAVYQLLERSHLGVAPYRETRVNYFEPVKILDYQMAGLPVVASTVGHIPHMVEDGTSGFLIPPGDVDALAAAIVKLAADPELRRDMGVASRLRAADIDETARLVLEVCRAAAANG
jgi:glycosyltransferase involved in cell wall biosynthesis